MNKDNSQSLVTKDYMLITLFSFLSSTASYMLFTGIPLYAVSLGAKNTIAGLMMGIFMITAILFRPIFGIMADYGKRKTVLLIGAFISVAACFSYIFALSIGVLLILRAFNGIGFSATTNASGIIATDVIPPSRMAEGIGFFGISTTVASAIAPALAIYIISYLGYKYLFIIATIISILSLICSYFINYEKNKIIPPRPHVKELFHFKNIFEKTAIPTSIVLVLLAATIGSLMTFVPLYAASKNINNIGMFFPVYALSLLLTRFFSGKIADRFSVSLVIVPGLITVIISMFLLSTASSLMIFIISAFLYGLGYGMAQPTLNAVMIKMCPIERRGAGNSTFYLAMDIGSGGGAVLWGYISQKLGFSAVYISCGICVFFALIAYFSLLRKQLKAVHVKPIETLVDL